MEQYLLAIGTRFRPELETSDRAEQIVGVADVAAFLYAVPLTLLGLAWLLAETDLALFAREWPALAVLFLLAMLFEQLRFSVYTDIKGGLFITGRGSLSSIATWAGALLFGPSALWLVATILLGDFVRGWRQTGSVGERWGRLRRLVLDAASTLPTGLVALALYERWGGTFPLSDLSLEGMLPALCSTLIQSCLTVLIYAPYVLYLGTRAAKLSQDSGSLWSFLRVASVRLVLPAMGAPFGVLAAGLYAQNGVAVFLFFTGGLLTISLLGRQWSQAIERSQQRSRELEELEQLAHAIMSGPPDASTLSELLQAHVPGMFPSGRIEVRRFPNEVLVRCPDGNEWPPVPDSLWDWLCTTAGARYFLPHQVRPWNDTSQSARQPQEPLVVAPVLNGETGETIGGVYVAPRRDSSDVASLLPAVQSLAAQISSTLHGAQVYNQALRHHRVEQELALAGEIQARFLPKVLPRVPGWQLAVTLEPARQTSGDFYDVIPLPNGRLGIVIADVADKGTAAALFMALSRTLIRTYAVEHHARPDYTMRVANNRILMDTDVDLFVTAFYGVLDPLTGTLTYANAGHNPPLLLPAQDGRAVQELTLTGLPLGVFRGESWEQRTVQLGVGDVLVLYTDGVTEAQNHEEVFFGEERLLAVAQAQHKGSAQEIKTAVMSEIRAFVGDAPQFDDIALLVVVREA